METDTQKARASQIRSARVKARTVSETEENVKGARTQTEMWI